MTPKIESGLRAELSQVTKQLGKIVSKERFGYVLRPDEVKEADELTSRHAWLTRKIEEADKAKLCEGGK